MAAYTEEKNFMPDQDISMGEFLRVDEIKVRCNFPVGQIKSLSIQERMGVHTVAEVSAGIEAGSMEITNQEFSGQPLVIESEKDGKKSLLFSGVISEVHMDKEAAYDMISVKAYSLSWLMDMEKKDKSYQGKTSILNLIQEIAKKNTCALLCFAEDKITEKPFIQYRETDWEFMERMSSHLHVPIYPANDYKGMGIYLGIQNHGTSTELHTLNERWCMDEKRMKSKNFDMRKAVYYEVITGQVLHIGQSVIYRHENLWPFKASMVLLDGMLYCTYRLAGAYYYDIPVCYNPNIRGMDLTGTVLERKNETFKIHLDIDDEQDLGKAYDYPWLPEYGNMVYCMPEEGSKVRLHIAGEDERNGIGTDCIRFNGNVCEETQIPDHKWFSTDKKKKITLQSSIVELSGEEGKSKITFQDGTGNSIRSSGEILIQAKGKVVVQGTKINLNAPSEITAVKRETGEPTVVNICHNLDVMGKKTKFSNLGELPMRSILGGGKNQNAGPGQSEESGKGKEEELKKLQFEMHKLLEQESEKYSFELGRTVINIASAIPQCHPADRLSQIATGFRPIMGRMKGE